MGPKRVDDFCFFIKVGNYFSIVIEINVVARVCIKAATQPCVKSKSHKEHVHRGGRATHFQSQKSSGVARNAAVLHAFVQQDPANESISVFRGLPCDRVLSGQNHNKHHCRTHRNLPVLVRGRLRWISSDLSHKLCCDCRCFMGVSHMTGTNQIMSLEA